MNVQQFYDALNLAIDLDHTLRLQTILESIRDNLNNLVASPANPTFQSSLANNLKTFEEAAAKLSQLTPSQRRSIAEINGKEFFDPSISESVRDSIAKNAMTPSVAKEFVQDLASRRASFLATLNGSLDGLAKLGVVNIDSQTEPVDLAFGIPRALFQDDLQLFSKELSFLNRLIQHFDEAISGEVRPVRLEQLSSSDPTVAVGAATLVAIGIQKVVSNFLDSWKKIEEIRAIRQRLKHLGLVDKLALTDLTETVKREVENVVKQSTHLTLEPYPKSDSSRRNELENALQSDIHRLFAQIERGLTVEIRLKHGADQPSTDDRNTIENLTKTILFPTAINEPILLTNGSIIDDDEILAPTTSRVSKKKAPATTQETHKTSGEAVKKDS